ncbi:DJ-1/PfpI family protein [Streptomyces sp. NBC_01614]
MHRHSVLIFLFEGVQALALSGPTDVFSCANSATVDGRLLYDVRTVSVDGGAVRASSGLRVQPDASFADVADVSTLLVPGADGIPRTGPVTVRVLGPLARRAERVASVGTGAFLLARTGLLDGCEAVTHWEFTEEFAHRFPRVTLRPESLVVTDGRIATSAGAASGVDLALSLVEEDLGRDVAQRTARSLVTYLRTPGGQAQFAAPRLREARSPALRGVQLQVFTDPGGDWSLRSLAERAGVSERHVRRLFRAQVGMTAREYVERVRVDVAARMLIESARSPDAIARESGFGNVAAMRRSFLRLLQVPPVEYRNRFS